MADLDIVVGDEDRSGLSVQKDSCKMAFVTSENFCGLRPLSINATSVKSFCVPNKSIAFPKRDADFVISIIPSVQPPSFRNPSRLQSSLITVIGHNIGSAFDGVFHGRPSPPMNSLANSVYLKTFQRPSSLTNSTVGPSQGVGVVLIVHFRELAAADVSVNGNIHDILSSPAALGMLSRETE